MLDYFGHFWYHISCIFVCRSTGLSLSVTSPEHPVGTEETMINFDEELAKYGPSLEISQAEEAVLSREIVDSADIIEKILQDKKDS